jgi:pyruvate/2-oxoglutarate dehydrogenase complex dihydrolipoamide acyltransferase (E2) component
MRNREYRRGTPAYRLAKAQGRLPSQIKAKKAAKKKAVQGPKTKAMSKPTAKQAGEKLMATFKKLTKVDKRSPSGRKIVDEKAVEETTGGGRGRGERLITFTPVEPIGSNRQGSGKQSKNRKLFGGTFTSRGNRR